MRFACILHAMMKMKKLKKKKCDIQRTLNVQNFEVEKLCHPKDVEYSEFWSRRKFDNQRMMKMQNFNEEKK